jgi:hypothetical protein
METPHLHILRDVVRMHCIDSKVIYEYGRNGRWLLVFSSPHALKGKEQCLQFWQGVVVQREAGVLHEIA